MGEPRSCEEKLFLLFQGVSPRYAFSQRPSRWIQGFKGQHLSFIPLDVRAAAPGATELLLPC